MLPFHQTISAFERQISKTRRYTNVVCCEVLSSGRLTTNVICCEVKILHSEQNPGPSAAPNSFRGERTAFFLSFFVVSLSHFVVWPLELGLGTRNPRFVAWPLELGLGTRNPRFVAWPLELGLGTLSSRFVVWPLELGVGDATFSAFFLGKCSKGWFPLQNLSKASMVPKPKLVCAET